MLNNSPDMFSANTINGSIQSNLARKDSTFAVIKSVVGTKMEVRTEEIPSTIAEGRLFIHSRISARAAPKDLSHSITSAIAVEMA